jgi:hypothetical protein
VICTVLDHHHLVAEWPLVAVEIDLEMEGV